MAEEESECLFRTSKNWQFEIISWKMSAKQEHAEERDQMMKRTKKALDPTMTLEAEVEELLSVYLRDLIPLRSRRKQPKKLKNQLKMQLLLLLLLANPQEKRGDFFVNINSVVHLINWVIVYREAAEALRKKEEYMKRHLAGETEEAKRDMARLAAIRRKREEAAAARAAEGRAPGMSATGLPEASESSDEESDDDDDEDSDEEGGASARKAAEKAAAAKAAADAKKAKISAAVEANDKIAVAAKKKAAAAAVDEPTTDGPPKLKSMDIKKMNGDALKDALKERSLDTQGQKKDLIKRLCDFEAARA